MNQQPDKFFRDKLEGFNRPAPARAWEKIEANLDKKNNAGLIWKVAAAILVIALCTYVLWPSHNNTSIQSEISQENSAKPKSQKPEPIQLPESNNTIAVQEPAKESKASHTHRGLKKNTQHQLPSPLTEEKTDDRAEEIISVAQHELPVSNPLTEEENINNVVGSEPVAEQQPMVVTASTENIKLVFHADATDEYLDKKALAEATDDQENTSTFKKLLKKAQGLKNNQDPFGDLRQKKNEILALNFKNEKRGQNK